MTRAGPAVAAVALALIVTSTAALPHVPPPPPEDAAFVSASCSSTQMGVPAPLAATVTSLSETPVAPKNTGALTMQWGVRVGTIDPRVGDVTALAFSEPYGLLATTGHGDWLTFDLQGGSLAQVKTVGVAPIRGAAGRPTAMADLYGSLSFVAFAAPTGTIARLALSTCGINAVAVPWLTTGATSAPVIVQAAYTYLGITAPDTAHGAALLLPYAKKDVALPATANLFVPAGERLIALANPARIVPDILALTARTDGRPGATLRMVHVEKWDDVRGGTSVTTREIARLHRTPSAMTSFRSASGRTSVILAFPTDTAGVIDLYRLDGQI